MSPGVANVSPHNGAFRFGPHGLKFKKPIKITLPYDRHELGEAVRVLLLEAQPRGTAPIGLGRRLDADPLKQVGRLAGIAAELVRVDTPEAGASHDEASV